MIAFSTGRELKHGSSGTHISQTYAHEPERRRRSSSSPSSSPDDETAIFDVDERRSRRSASLTSTSAFFYSTDGSLLPCPLMQGTSPCPEIVYKRCTGRGSCPFFPYCMLASKQLLSLVLDLCTLRKNGRRASISRPESVLGTQQLFMLC